MTPLALWINDLRWAANMIRARRYRRGLLFSKRQDFDDALRPPTVNPLPSGKRRVVIGYPDAIYCITIEDVVRAMGSS